MPSSNSTLSGHPLTWCVASNYNTERISQDTDKYMHGFTHMHEMISVNCLYDVHKCVHVCVRKYMYEVSAYVSFTVVSAVL